MKPTLLIGFLSRAVSLGGNLILLPLILVKFSPAEYAVWAVFLTSSSLAIILDCGFSAVVSRYFTYIMSGCNELPEGVLGNEGQISTNNSIDANLFNLLYKFTNYLYFFLASLLALTLFIFWQLYIKQLAVEKNIDISLPWILFSFSIVLTLYFNKFNAYFFGINKVSSVYKSSLISGVFYIIVAIVMMRNDASLMALAVAKLTYAFVYFMVSYFEFWHSKQKNLICDIQPCYQDYIDLFLKMKASAFKTGVFTLGAFCLNRSSTFFIAKYLPEDEGASLLLLVNLFSTALSVIYIYMNTKTPELNASVYKLEYKKVYHLQCDIYIKSILIFIASALCLIALGDNLLDLLRSQTKLPCSFVMLYAALIFLGELIFAISTNFLTSHNNLSYAKYVAYSGGGYLFMAMVIFPLYPNQMVVLTCQLVVQLLYNFWYWPFSVYRKLVKYRSI